MRCSTVALDLSFPILLTIVLVLSAVMDVTAPTLEHGIRAPLVSILSALRGACPPYGC